jgi:hypothetical protein
MAYVKQHKRRLPNGKVITVKGHERKGGQVAKASADAVGRGAKKAGKKISKMVRRRNGRPTPEWNKFRSDKARWHQRRIEQLRDRTNALRPLESNGQVDKELLAAYASKGFDEPSAKAWNQARFTADEAAGWKADGFGLAQAKEWRSLNFTRMEAAGWKGSGYSAAAARRSIEERSWTDKTGTTAFGGSIEVAMGYHRRGFTLEEAIGWAKCDVTPKTAAVLRANGVTLADMAA